MAQTYFATIEPGLEEALLGEVRDLGGKRAKAIRGGVEFDATNTVFYRAALRLRCANRLWLRVDEFRARDKEELYRKTKRFEWDRLLPPGAQVRVVATSRRSRLNHTGLIEETVQAALPDAAESGKTATQLTVMARLDDDRCELSLDATGEILFRRGWKRDVGHAPLRETVAASILRLADWTPDLPVVDPLCGSGTFVIEAAQRSAGIAASANRDLDFHQWANFRSELWEEVAAEPNETHDARHRGADADSDVVSGARANAARAGVDDRTTFEVAEVANLPAPSAPRGLLVANPPWNLRIADESLSAAGQFVEVAERDWASWTAALVVPRTRPIPDGWDLAAGFDLGGVPVRVAVRRPR